jgi:hypothetical protein
MRTVALAGDNFLLTQELDKTGGRSDEIEIKTELLQFQQAIPDLFLGALRQQRYFGMGVVVSMYLRSSSSKRMAKPP